MARPTLLHSVTSTGWSRVPRKGREKEVMPMKKAIRLRILGTVAIAAALALPTGSAMAAGPGPAAYTCGGGSVGGGTYASLTITGFCDVVPGAVIDVVGNLTVAPGAFFDAQSSPSTITVGKSATAAAGSFLGLGCQPFSLRHDDGSPITSSGHPCQNDPTGHSVILVKGNVSTTDANTVLLNGITVNGNVTLTGGGGEIPWSLKVNHVMGNFTVDGVAADWVGIMRNVVGKNLNVINVTVTDPDPLDLNPLAFVAVNNVGWNLNCFGILPGVSGGFNPFLHNIVGRHANGQCAGPI
jgi:hypothetical protein